MPVTCPVVAAFRGEHGNAPIQHLIMAAETAAEHRNRRKLAIHSPAQVNRCTKLEDKGNWAERATKLSVFQVTVTFNPLLIKSITYLLTHSLTHSTHSLTYLLTYLHAYMLKLLVNKKLT